MSASLDHERRYEKQDCKITENSGEEEKRNQVFFLKKGGQLMERFRVDGLSQ